MSDWDAMKVARKTGQEPFRAGHHILPFDLLSFWQWSASDLVSNAMRGVLAEYLVAQALGIARDARVEWNAYDLRMPSGLTVEVKTAGYVQTWAQRGPSSIGFDVGLKLGWDASTNTYLTERKRAADVYVFALHAHRDKRTVDPLDIRQWEFFVLPTRVLDGRRGEQKRITLASLLSLDPARPRYEELAEAVQQAGCPVAEDAGGRPSAGQSVQSAVPRALGSGQMRDFGDDVPGAGDAEFRQWLVGNPAGYFVNVMTRSKGMLHRGRCPHMAFGPEDRSNLVKRLKWTSGDMRELEARAAREGITLTRCFHCDV